MILSATWVLKLMSHFFCGTVFKENYMFFNIGGKMLIVRVLHLSL